MTPSHNSLPERGGHTPGPWHYSPSGNFAGEYIIQGSYENGGGPRLPVLGRTHNFPQHAEANARLIAAAPALLAALKSVAQLRASIRVWAISNRIPGWQNEDALFAAIDAAIQAAEGQS